MREILQRHTLHRIKHGLLVILIAAISQANLHAQTVNELVAEREAVLGAQFEKELVRVTDSVRVAVGFGASNSVLIEGDEGLIIVDTMLGTEAAEHVRRMFLSAVAKPVQAIVYTHRHTDHTGGAAVFARGFDPEIYARAPAIERLSRYDELEEVLYRRAVRQFGSQLPVEEKIDGLAPVQRPNGGRGAGKLAATRALTSEREHLELVGIELELIAAPGETSDHQLVWLPQERVLICGDNFYSSFPNLYAIRGTSYRDVSRWVQSLDLMLGLGAEHLISGHARPISGSGQVREVLSSYRDAIDYVLSETLRGANRGLTPDQLAASIRLPEELADKPYLQEYYGVISWSVRSIYAGYLGWFDGNPTRLFPLSPKDEATRMVELAGSEDKLLEAAGKALAGGDSQWACELADHLLILDPDASAARAIKAEALRQLAARQMSSNARHYYLSVAMEFEQDL
jgi:alkyl sulfatase BDS1-like metallo-beta-lactamase superfamily hydrolase